MARAIVMPSLGMYTAEGTVLRWLKPAGAPVEAGEPVLELETEKAVAEIPAPAAGILHPVAEPGAIVQVEALLGYVLAPDESPPSAPAAPAPAAEPASERLPVTTAAPRPTGMLASPNVRRIARDLHVDLAAVTGSGPDGRITEDDVRAAAGRASS